MVPLRAGRVRARTPARPVPGVSLVPATALTLCGCTGSPPDPRRVRTGIGSVRGEVLTLTAPDGSTASYGRFPVG